MINCIIIDDDLICIKLLEHFISNTEGLNLVDTFSNPVLASNYLRNNSEEIQLVFLDVEMPELSGLELLESFQNLPPVILTTAKEKYAVKAFEHKVIHYLVKPIDYARFLKSIERVYQFYETKNKKNNDYIFVKSDGVLHKVTQSDICYCEALGDYVKIVLKTKTHVVNSTMKNIEDKLKLNKNFVRVHRSYIINIKYLENFDAETAVVAGKVIPIGARYKQGLQGKVTII